jgi:hypothetical protein
MELYHDRVDNIIDDRQLFQKLRWSYRKHRGRFRSIWSLRTLRSIHFMKVCIMACRNNASSKKSTSRSILTPHSSSVAPHTGTSALIPKYASPATHVAASHPQPSFHQKARNMTAAPSLQSSRHPSAHD